MNKCRDCQQFSSEDWLKTYAFTCRTHRTLLTASHSACDDFIPKEPVQYAFAEDFTKIDAAMRDVLSLLPVNPVEVATTQMALELLRKAVAHYAEVWHEEQMKLAKPRDTGFHRGLTEFVRLRNEINEFIKTVKNHENNR